MAAIDGYIAPDRRLTIGLSDGSMYSAKVRQPIIVCLHCHITVGGIVRVGMRCPMCAEPLVDLHAEIDRKRVEYDPAHELIERLIDQPLLRRQRQLLRR